MNASHKVALFVRILFVLVVLAAVSALLMNATSSPATAQSPEETSESPNFRLLENRTPEHLPIKVRIKREKEKTFRDLDNENWARDLELEVKNTGDKPIYTLFFYLLVPEAKIANGYQAFSIFYGRVALSKWEERPMPEDVPIKPGETVVLKIEDTGILGWNDARKKGLVPHRIHGVRLVFQDLSFGDGTGFDGTSGAPWPRPGTKNGQGACLQPPSGYGSRFERAFGPAESSTTQNNWTQLHAGKFQPASFFPRESTGLLALGSIDSTLPEPDCNCANDSCRFPGLAKNPVRFYCSRSPFGGHFGVSPNHGRRRSFSARQNLSYRLRSGGCCEPGQRFAIVPGHPLRWMSL